MENHQLVPSQTFKILCPSIIKLKISFPDFMHQLVPSQTFKILCPSTIKLKISFPDFINNVAKNKIRNQVGF